MRAIFYTFVALGGISTNMDVLISVALILVGIALVIWGADKLTAGAVGVAAKLGVPQMVIGLTIVAMGTSAPELFVSLMSAIKDSPDLAVGNIVGSNIFNALTIVGLSAIVVPIGIATKTIKVDLPITVAAGLLLLVLSLDGDISRIDAAILFVCFIAFLAYTLYDAKKEGADAEDEAGDPLSTVKSVLYIVLGLAGLVFGSDLFVDGATGAARIIGISDAVIGLTIVAAGTSLPELATSIVAARKGNSAIAIGNVIGSNIFNILLILGVTGLISPMHIAGVGAVDMGVMAASGLLMWLFCATKHEVERWEGAVMVAVYVGYVAYLIYNI